MKFIGEVKNGSIKISFQKMIITSNYLPHELYLNDPYLITAVSRRFRFAECKGKYPNFELNYFIYDPKNYI